MKILISGATGLVGSELGKTLAKQGHKLFVLTRSKEKAMLQCPFPQTPVSWNELDTHPDLSELDGVINLAGANLFEKRWTKTYKKIIYDSRVKGTEQLVDMVNRRCSGLRFFISTSAIGIYGETKGEIAHEDSPLSYDFLGKVCQDWEAPLNHLKVGRPVILRLGIVMSEKDGALSQMVPPIQSGIGGPLAGGKNHVSWIDIDDLVSLFQFAIEKPIKGTFNATAPNPETNKVMTQEIAKHLDVMAIFPVPYVALRLALGEVAPHIVADQQVSSQKIQKEGFIFKTTSFNDCVEKRVPRLKKLERRFIFEQWLPKTRDEVFPFFSDAKNLETITPANLHFKILRKSTENIEEGTEIFYKLRVDGIPFRWKTRILKWNPPHQFVDLQEKGPYKKWHHTHNFEDLAGGTLITDQVDLMLPFSGLGFMAAAWKVLSDVRKIFDYRRKVIFDLMGNKGPNN